MLNIIILSKSENYDISSSMVFYNFRKLSKICPESRQNAIPENRGTYNLAGSGKVTKTGAKKGHGELHLFYGAWGGTWRNGGQTPVWAKKDWNESLEKSISSPGEGNGPESRNTD